MNLRSLAIVCCACAVPDQEIATELKPVSRAPDSIDAGVLLGSACTTQAGKLVVWFQDPMGPPLCVVLLYRSGASRTEDPVARGLSGIAGYGLVQVRAGAFCEWVEASDGGLNFARSFAVDEIWGELEKGVEYEGRLQSFYVREGGAVRIGRNIFALDPGLFTATVPCQYP